MRAEKPRANPTHPDHSTPPQPLELTRGYGSTGSPKQVVVGRLRSILGRTAPPTRPARALLAWRSPPDGMGGTQLAAVPGALDLNMLRDLQTIVHLDPEVAQGRFERRGRSANSYSPIRVLLRSLQRFAGVGTEGTR
jgi:hypothetical protein